MAPVQGDTSILGVQDRPASEEPSPLRIVKSRGGSEGSFVGADKRNSWHSDESAPGHLGTADGRLTIMKRRSGRISLASSLIPGCEHINDHRSRHSSGSRSVKDSLKAWGDRTFRARSGCAGSQTLNIDKTRISRPCLNSQLGLWPAYANDPKAGSSSGRRNSPQNSISAKRPASQGETIVEHLVPLHQDEDDLPPKAPGHIDLLSAPPPPVHGRAPGGRYVLCPHIAVTTDVTAIYNNQQRIWAAVEVSGRLSKVLTDASAALSGHSGVITGSFIDHDHDRFFEFGCLYDLTVEVLPLPGASIQRVLREQTFPTTICTGSSILMLVQLHFQTPQTFQQGHVRQRSEELMEDLEIQLGSSQSPYMQVRVSYAHSAFPDHSSTEGGTGAWANGISKIQTRMETTAVASLKRHNSLSPWSPRPAPASNILFQLIERHWGPEKAQEAMQQILVQRSVARKPAKANSKVSLNVDLNDSSPTGVGHVEPLPMVPQRQGSSQKESSPRSSLHPTNVTPSPDLYSYRSNVCHERSPAADVTPPTVPSRRAVVQTQTSRARHSHEAVWPSPSSSGDRSCKRRSFGSEGFKGLIPKFPDTNGDGRQSRGSSSRQVPATMRLRGKKETGRWAWASWF